MGNSSSHNSSKSQLAAQNVQHGGHSLPRDLRGAGGSASAIGIGGAGHKRNGGFKVLPERVPGQKLRMTDNGNVLQNGGTLSGRRLLGGEPEPPDIDFSKISKRRSAEVSHQHHHRGASGSRSDYEDGDPGAPSMHGGSRGGAPPKRYHSDPDLLNSPGIISGNPEGFRHYSVGEPKKQGVLQQQLQQKTRAPPPPHLEPLNTGSQSTLSANHNQRKGNQSPAKETNKRTFANFLKSSNKKSNSKQDLNNSRHHEQLTTSHPGGGDYMVKNKHASLPTPQNNSSSAEVASTKFDAKNKSTTYVLERREHHGSSSVLSGGGGSGSGTPSGNINGQSKIRATPDASHNESFVGENRRFVKNGCSSPSDNRSLLTSPTLTHPNVQAKLSDSSILHARSIDRSDVRNRALELQKRVRSMESLSCSDDRDINLNPTMSGSKNQFNERYNRQHASSKDVNMSLENLQNPSSHQLSNSWYAPVARKSSNSSSVLSENRRGKSPNDKMPLRQRYSAEETSSFDKSSRLSTSLLPPLDSKHRDSSASNTKKLISNDSFDAYLYGTSSKQATDNHHRRQTMDNYMGSLDKRSSNGSKPHHHQRTPSDTEIGNISYRATNSSLLLPSDKNGRDNLHNNDIFNNIKLSKKVLSNSDLRRTMESHDSFSHSMQDHISKIKAKPSAGLNDLLGEREPRKRDSFTVKKDLHDKIEHVDERLQESFFLKAKEPLNRIAEYSGRMAPPIKNDSVVKTKTPDGGDLSEDEMDINMQLRPTLPKRLQAMPRFSPTQVWRSFTHDELGGADNKNSDRSSDGEEGDVFEDRIQRVARPMAPPRGSNEKSADSGISPGAGSPLPVMYDFDAVLVPEKSGCATSSSALNSVKVHSHSKKLGSHNHQHDSHYRPPPPISPAMGSKNTSNEHQHNSSRQHLFESPIRACTEDKKPAWTPEEDLASDFDAGSGDNHHSPGLQSPPLWNAQIPDMISSQPKLIYRKDMFNSKQNLKPLLDSESRLLTVPNLEGHDTDAQLSESPPDAQQDIIKTSKKGKHSKNGEQQSTPQKYNSVRKLKRSLSGVLQGNTRLKSAAAEDSRINTSLDENWSLSRSLPNSLHNGHDGGHHQDVNGGKYSKNRSNKAKDSQVKNQQQHQQRLPRSESGPVFVMSRQQSSELAYHRQPFSDLEGRSFHDERSRGISVANAPCNSSTVKYNRGGHIVYLPKYEAMQIVSENDNDVIFPERRAYSDLGMGTNIDSSNGGGVHYNNDNAKYITDTSGIINNQNRHHYPFRKPKKFTYQSTVRQNERFKLEQKLSQEVAIKEHQRNREQELVKKVEEEFQKKRHKEKADIRQQLRILSLESNGAGQNDSTSKNYADNPFSSSFEDDEDELNMSSLNVHAYHDVLPPDDRHERAHLSLPPLLIPPEDYDLTVPRATHYNSRIPVANATMGGSSNSNPRRISHSMYHKQEPVVMMPISGNNHHTNRMDMDPISSTNHSGGNGFFSGIGKWMRRQQRLEKSDDGDRHSPSSRQEPEGAPSSLGSRRTPPGYVPQGNSYQPAQDQQQQHSYKQQNGTDHRPSPNPPSSPFQESRSQAIVGAKFSSGRPENSGYLHHAGSPSKFGNGPSQPSNQQQQRKSIYTHLQEVTEKEDRMRKHDALPEGMRTSSVWISPDKSYIKSPPSFNMPKMTQDRGGFGGSNEVERNGSDFYDMPYDSIPPGMSNGARHDNGKFDSQQHGRDKDISNRPYQNSSLQRDWSAGQRHSIAIDTSRGGQWSAAAPSSTNPIHNDHADTSSGRMSRGRENSLSSHHRSSQQNNGYSSGDLSRDHQLHQQHIRRDNQVPDSYRDSQEGNSLNYRQNYTEDKGLAAHHRSLSFSHIPEWDGGPPSNIRKNDAASPRIPISRVQPFNPNQVYRPVAFPPARQQGNSNYN